MNLTTHSVSPYEKLPVKIAYVPDPSHEDYIAGQTAAASNAQLASPECDGWIYEPVGVSVQWGLGHAAKMQELNWTCASTLPQP